MVKAAPLFELEYLHHNVYLTILEKIPTEFSLSSI